MNAALTAAREAAGLVEMEPSSLPTPASQSSRHSSSNPQPESLTQTHALQQQQRHKQSRRHATQEPVKIGHSAAEIPSPEPVLWMGDSMKVPTFNGPSDSHAYLGDNMFTLAGRIYWDYITHVVLRWRKYVLTQKLGTHRFNAQLGQMRDEDMLVAMAEVRVHNWRKGHGYLNWNDTVANSISPVQMADLTRCVKDNTRREGDLANHPGLWKTAHEVEEYIRERVSSELLDDVVATVEGRADARTQKEFGVALANVARNAVCFGSGPRWNIFYLSMAVGSWLTHINEHTPLASRGSGGSTPEEYGCDLCAWG
jgi:hypothetical protein